MHQKIKTYFVLVTLFVTGFLLLSRIKEGDSEEYQSKIVNKLKENKYQNINIISRLGICNWPRGYAYGIETSFQAQLENKIVKASVCDNGNNLTIKKTL